MKRVIAAMLVLVLALLLCACGSQKSEAPEPTAKPLATAEDCEATLKKKLPDARDIHIIREDDYDSVTIIFDAEDEFEIFSRHLLDSMYACIETYGKNVYWADVIVVNAENNHGITGSFLSDEEDVFCEVSYILNDRHVHEEYETLEDFLAAYPTVSVK